ncbi:MAG: PH domain-containing protein [Janthinobacterium lividum]
MAVSSAPITFPRTFSADIFYRLGAILFSLVGVIGLGLAASRHQSQSILVMALPFIVFFGAVLLTWTFELVVDEKGLHQRSILGRKEATWDQVQRLDQSRAYSIHGTSDSELVWMSLVSTAAQEAIAEEAIRRADLRLSKAKAEYPLKRQWLR